MKTIHAYNHPPPASSQAPNPAAGNYYVSVQDGPRWGLLLGPFNRHADALARVEEGRELAEQADPRAAFYAFGTVRMVDEYTTPGRFNEAIGLKVKP